MGEPQAGSPFYLNNVQINSDSLWSAVAWNRT
jgi:hypothetical protein